MKLVRAAAALLLVAILAGVAYVRQASESSGLKMTHAAEQFISLLNADQKAKGVLAFDDKDRTNWQFVPYQDASKQPKRKGLRLEEMTEAQKQAARDLLRAGTSATGYTKAINIMSLEAILKELEQGRGPTRNPQWYFFTIFGNPSNTSRWGWRVEGHHLSLNFVVDGGKIAASTPAFFGANPATVKQGKRKGLRTLPEAEDLARKLFKSLDVEQRNAAYQQTEFPEIAGGTSAPKVGRPRGLPAARMKPEQRTTLMQLIEAYAHRMPADIAAAELAGMRNAGIDQVHFAYAGGQEAGKPYTYRVQGPTFVIEFLNVQADSAGNRANHIHSAWRDMEGDFGITH